MTRFYPIILLVVAGLVAAVAIFTYGRQQQAIVDQSHAFAVELRNGLVASCEKNSNPLRMAVAAQLEQQIKQSHNFDYSQFFPSVPPAILQRLIAKQNARDRRELRQIKPVDCEALYPKP